MDKLNTQGSLDPGLWLPDLHIHTTASDGSLTPSQVVRKAAERGLNIISITDHDTLSGLKQAKQAAQEQNIGFIRGIEISAEGDREVHILGYSINAGNKAFDNLIEALRHDRISRERKYLNTLQDMHIFISSADLRIPSGSLFSRPLLAKAMKDKGYVNSMQEAFDMYLGAGKPAYVPKLSVTADEVIKTLCLAGAVPVIAHPGLLHLSSSDLEKQIIQWKASGLMGIEVYHPSHNQLDCQKLLLLAKKYNLLVTGGSDFHEKADLYHGELGQMLSFWHEASIDTSKLLASIH